MTLSSLFLLTTAATWAQATPPADAAQIQPEDAFTLDAIGSFAVSSRGSKVVYTRYRWEPRVDGRVADLWLLDTRTRRETRLTFDDAIESQPVMLDDKTVAYLRQGTDGRQVFRLSLAGGPPQQITHVDGGIGKLKVAGNGLYYVVSDHQPKDDSFAGLRGQHAGLEYGHDGHEQSSLHRIDRSTWRDEAIDTPTGWIMDLAVTDDESKVALLHAPDRDLITHEGGSNVVVIDRAAGTTTTLDDTLWRADAPSPYGWLVDLAWSTDGKALAHRVDFDGYPGETFVTEFSAATGPLTWTVPRPREITPRSGALSWVPGKRELCVTADEASRVRLVCVDGLKRGASGRDRSFPEGNVVVQRYAFSEDGRDLIALVATPTALAELYRMPARGRLLPTRLTHTNPHTDDWAWPTVDLVSWKAPDGTTVEGILETPAGWTTADGPLPLLVSIHGGPTAARTFNRRFSYTGHTAFAAKGYALLSPNYRGSTGYGDAFLTELIGRENDVEVDDILAGVDHLIAQGIADPDRMAVSGWSNGGYLTNCLIATTDRFKAASSGAGVFDKTMQWATEDTPGHVVNYMKGLPWEQPQDAVNTSPLYAADKIVTPTLIHVGENDPRVPAVHARALFRALSFYLDIPTELVVYPRTGHGLSKLSHRKAKVAWEHAWFDRYVTGADASDDGSEGSVDPAPASTEE